MRMKLMLTVFLVGLGLLMCVPAEAATITLQNGVNGYSGCEDAGILRETETDRKKNLGDYDNLNVKYDASGDDEKAALIRFSDLGIPAGQAITNAKLRLYVPDGEVIYTPGGVITVSPLLVHVADFGDGSRTQADTGEVCWWQLAYGQTDWASAGNDGPLAGSDYDDGVKITAPIPESGDTWVEWDLTSVVQGWYSGSLANEGLYIYGDPSGSNNFGIWPSSCEATTVGNRPQLVVEYSAVPEPGVMTFLFTGTLALAAYAWRRRK